MSSDKNSTPFLPKSLLPWLQLLAMIGIPVAATWGLLVYLWRATEEEVLVNTRLLLVLTISVALGFGALWWYSRQRYKRLAKYESAKVKLASEEEEILKLFVSHDTEALGPHWVAEQMGYTPFRFQHHWYQVFGVHHFLDRANDDDGEEGYMLSHAGRAYVAANGLDR